MFYGFDDFDYTIKVANKRRPKQDTELMTLTEEEKHFIRGTLFGIGVGIGLMLLMMIVMACI